MYKMMLVDDDYITREGLRDLIDWTSLGIKIAGEAEDGEEALKKSKDHPAPYYYYRCGNAGHERYKACRRVESQNA